jgi:predicted RND superfamily exporter protein
MIRDFGVLLAAGVAAVCLAALVVPTAALALRERRAPSTRERHQRIVEAGMRRLGHVPATLAIPLVLVAVALFTAGLFAEHRTPIETDPNRWVDQNSKVIRDIDAMQAQTGASSELGIFVQAPGGTLTDETSAFVTSLAATELERFPGKLSNVSSLPTTVAYLMEVPGASALPPTGRDLSEALAVAPAALRPTLVAERGTAQNVIFQTGPSTLEVRKEVIEDVRATARPPDGVSATPSGLAVIGVGLLDNLTANRLLLAELAIGGVFVWLLVRFRHLVTASLVMVPVLFAVGLSATVVKLSGITVSPLSTVGSPLIIAISGEFASLILFRHLEERRQGAAPRAAIDVAAARTGRAFFASSLTTVGGFAVLLASPLPLLRDFGAIVAITIAIALFSAMLVLPPLLVWADERGRLPTHITTGDTDDVVVDLRAADGAGGPPPPGPERDPTLAPAARRRRNVP